MTSHRQRHLELANGFNQLMQSMGRLQSYQTEENQHEIMRQMSLATMAYIEDLSRQQQALGRDMLQDDLPGSINDLHQLTAPTDASAPTWVEDRDIPRAPVSHAPNNDSAIRRPATRNRLQEELALRRNRMTVRDFFQDPVFDPGEFERHAIPPDPMRDMQDLSVDMASLPDLHDTACSICLDCYEDDKEKQWLATNCLHVFHESCLKEWYKTSASCPLCKAT